MHNKKMKKVQEAIELFKNLEDTNHNKIKNAKRNFEIMERISLVTC